MRKQAESGGGFEPRIIGFICNWSAYSGLEMAGVNHREYPSSVHFIRLMCLGRVHDGLILKAFEAGADGVLLLGCPAGNCHYEFGIDRVKESLNRIGKMMRLLGLGARRIRLVEVPAGDDKLVAREITAFDQKIRNLGPSPVKRSPSPRLLEWDAAQRRR
ncbi:MAG: hydrogenase iron-sulfur subunit [Dehalococcoidia bacterium]